MTFREWLKERGYTGQLGSSAFRCKLHGYRQSGVFHYPMVEDRHTYYSCMHCLRETFETNPDAMLPQTPISRDDFVPTLLSDDVIKQASQEMEDWPW